MKSNFYLALHSFCHINGMKVRKLSKV